NWIAITDLSASRKHCTIAGKDENFRVIDLESRNGTYVNGIPIRERALVHGDQIDLGDSSFVFLLQEDLPGSPPALLEGLEAHATVRIRVEDALYLQPEKLLTSHPLTARIMRGLDSVLKLSRSMQSVQATDAIVLKLFESLFPIIPAQRGSVLLTDGA